MGFRMKTAELTGVHLDYWVAKAEGHALTSEWNQETYVLIGAGTDEDLQRPFQPSTDWVQGGPIMEREGIVVFPTLIEWDAVAGKHMADGFEAMYEPSCYYDHTIEGDHKQEGRTMLITAMRAYVARKFGDEVPT